MFNVHVPFFYVYGSVHHWSISITVQQDATQNSLFIILQVHCTCFRCQPHPSSGAHKTVTTASGTGHIFCAATSLQRGQAWPHWREVVAVPEAVVTVLCTPDDGCGWHPKHVQWTCRIIDCSLLHLTGQLLMYMCLLLEGHTSSLHLMYRIVSHIIWRAKNDEALY